MLKTIANLLLALLLALSLSACGDKTAADRDENTTPDNTQATEDGDYIDIDDGWLDFDETDIPEQSDTDTGFHPGDIFDTIDDEDGDTVTEDDELLDMSLPEPGASTVSGNIVRFGKYSWIVLEVQDGNAFLLSEKTIDFLPFVYGGLEETVWSNSALRGWLNGTFLKESFTQEELSRIQETAVVNANNPWFATKGGEDTKDSVFILSVEETVEYFGDSGLLNGWTDKSVWVIDDEFNQNRTAEYFATGSPAWWWLRTPGMNGTYAACVNRDGVLNVGGENVGSGGGGVRPVIWIEL